MCVCHSFGSFCKYRIVFFFLHNRDADFHIPGVQQLDEEQESDTINVLEELERYASEQCQLGWTA